MRILRAPIEALMRGDCAQMEIDPQRLKPGQTVEANWARLEQHLLAFMNVILSSSHLMPAYAPFNFNDDFIDLCHSYYLSSCWCLGLFFYLCDIWKLGKG
jgi:hypothetical protein